MALRRRRLQWLFGVSSASMVVVLLAFALVSLKSIADSHRAASDAARAELAEMEDAGELESLFYQKGFVAEYLLTGDAQWLTQLEEVKPAFEAWLTRLTVEAVTEETGSPTAELVAEYGRYDAERARAVATFNRGDREGAIRAQLAATEHAARLRHITDRLNAVRRGDVNARLASADRAWHRALWGLGLASLVAVLGAAIFGDLLARRVARPLYQLVLRAESAAGGAHVEVSSDDEIGALADHVTRLAREIERSSSVMAEQRARLTQAEKMSALGEMATAVAHELLNPLTGVKTAMQLLARTNPTAAVIETTTAVDEEIRRVEEMARRLMAFAKPIAPSVRACDLEEILPRVLAAARAAAAAHRVRIEPRFDELHSVTADPDLLGQVLINLTVNACQAMSIGGTVQITLRRDQGFRVIDVSDDGPGLPQAVRARLFAPFVTTRRDGHGLGLAISQAIAHAHGGRIEAHDGVPRGTVFSIFLPEVLA